MREGWAIKKLGDVADVISGKNQKEVENPQGDYPIYGSGGIFGRANAYICEAGTTVIGRKGTINTPIYVNERFWNVDTAFGIHPKSGNLLPKFLYYFCKGFNFKKLDKSTTIPSLAKRDIVSIDIPLPPLPEQKSIVAKIEELFSELDNGIANLQEARRKIDIYRQSVLKKAFEGELTKDWRSRQPNLSTGEELLAQIQTERQRRWLSQRKYKTPEPVKGIHAISTPKGWTLATIDQLVIAPPCNGVSIKGSETPPGVRALKLNAMMQTGFDYDEHRFLPLPEEKASEIWIKESDFFVSRGNGSLHLVGRGVSAQKPPYPVIFPDTMIRLRLAPEIVQTKWIEAIWQSRLIREQVEQSVKTTAGIYKISQSEIKNFVVPLPSLEEQTQIVQEIESRVSVCDKLTETIDTSLKQAEALRQSILKKFFKVN